VLEKDRFSLQLNVRLSTWQLFQRTRRVDGNVYVRVLIVIDSVRTTLLSLFQRIHSRKVLVLDPLVQKEA